MDQKEVLIIHNRNIDIEVIEQDLREEKYPYKFTFGDMLDFNFNEFDKFDEVWTFGDVRATLMYKKVKSLNMDIWEMM